jgi:hypothetical protein
MAIDAIRSILENRITSLDRVDALLRKRFGR